MKKTTTVMLNLLLDKLTIIKKTAFILFLFQGININAQQTYTFTNAGAIGSSGPTQTQINTAYAATNLSAAVTTTNGIQTWTVPASGLYLIDTRGASGGSTNSTYNKAGGLGARMQGQFNLLAGQVLSILVGQVGVNGCGTGGGGGGSYVVNTGTLLIASGGGGGASSDQLGGNTTTLTSGSNDNPGGSIPGGTAGSGGQVCNSAGANHGGGGGGYIGNGGTSTLSSPGGGGLSFLNGGTGGTGTANGGFGGGGGGTNCTVGGGGGGGYSGGAGGQQVNYCMSGLNRTGGGGGGSFNAGISQTNTPAFNVGDGRVIITSLCNINLTSSGTNSLAPSICAGTSLTLTTNAVSNYSWSSGASTSSIVVTPTVTTTYSLVATSASNCNASSAITITVSPGIPTISIASSTNQICLGKTVTLTASGALSYTWGGGISNGIGFAPSTTSNYVVSGQNGCGSSTAAVSISVAPLAVTAISTNSQVCAGQTTTLIATSAVTGYTWLPFGFIGSNVIVSPNLSTIYTVTASDGTCAGTATVSVSALPIPTITSIASSTNICEGNSSTLTASGGLSYVWQPGNLTGASIVVTPSIPTLYTVIGVSSNSCFSSSNQVVIVNASPILTGFSSDPIICSGGSATLSISGASTYTWNTSSNSNSIIVNPTQTTVYTVDGQNSTNTCVSTTSITVAVFIPTVAISGNTAICSGASASLQANGGGTYQWSNGVQASNIVVSPLLTTPYSVSALTSSGGINCPSSATVQVVVNPNPTVVAVASRSNICKGESTTLTSSGALTYSWLPSASGPSVTVTSSLVTTLVYSVSGSNSFGCVGSNSVAIKVNSCVGIDRELMASTDKFNVYPNPNNGTFSIVSLVETHLTLVNNVGQIMKTFSLNKQNEFQMNVSDLSEGIYYIMAFNESSHYGVKVVVFK